MSLLGTYLNEDSNYLDRSVMTDQELEGVLAEAAMLDPAAPERAQVVRKINRGAKNNAPVVPTDDLTIRAQYSLRAHMLPEPIRMAIANNQIKIVNKAFYKIAEGSGLKQFDIMLNADTKLSGITNVNSRKLEENDYFLLTAIILQTATFTTYPWDAAFGMPCKELLNGEFSLKNGDKILVQPSSCRIFDTTSKMNRIQGEWKLDNPKFIAPMVEIIPELKLPKALPAKTAVKMVLVGAGLSKA